MSSLTSSALFAPVIPRHSLERRCYGGDRGARRTHRSTKTTVDLQHRELLEGRGVALGKVGVGHDLVLSWRANAVPLTEGGKRVSEMWASGHRTRLHLLLVGTLGEVTREEVEEGLHLGVERLGSM